LKRIIGDYNNLNTRKENYLGLYKNNPKEIIIMIPEEIILLMLEDIKDYAII